MASLFSPECRHPDWAMTDACEFMRCVHRALAGRFCKCMFSACNSFATRVLYERVLYEAWCWGRGGHFGVVRGRCGGLFLSSGAACLGSVMALGPVRVGCFSMLHVHVICVQPL